MKKNVFFLFILIFFSPFVVQASNNDMVTKYKLVNRKGNAIIEKRFDYVQQCHKHDCYIVKFDNKYSLIDENGKEQLQDKYDMIREKDGYFVLKKGKLYSVVDFQTNTLLDFQKYDVEGIYGDKFLVNTKSGKSFVNKEGNLLFIPKSGTIKTSFLDSLIMNNSLDDEHFVYELSTNNLVGVLDINGNYILEPIYKSIKFVNDNYIIVEDENKKSGVFNLKGEEVLPIKYDRIYHTGKCKDLFGIQIDRKYGFLSLSNNKIVEPQYDSVDFQICDIAGLMPVKKDDKYGFIDRNGNYKIKPIYNSISYINEHYYVVKNENKKYGLRDKNGDEILPAIYDKILRRKDFYSLEKDKKHGFIFKKDNKVIEPIYDDVGHMYYDNDGIINVKKGDKWGALSNHGEQIIDFVSIYSIYNKEGLGKITTQESNIKEKKEIKLPDEFEVHVISGHSNPNKEIDVVVDRPNKNVFLILNTFYKTNWNISSTSNTKIVKVVYGGSRKNTVRTDKNISLTEKYFGIIAFEFYSTLKKVKIYIKEEFDKDRIDSITSFVGKSMPERIKVDRVMNRKELLFDFPKIEKFSHEIRFKLNNKDGKEVSLSVHGDDIGGKYYPPKAKIIDKTGRYSFKLGRDSIFVKDEEKSTIKEYKKPFDFPEFIRVDGFNYYPEKNQILVHDLNGQFIHKFDVSKMKWSNYLNKGYGGYTNVVYDKFTKLFWSVTFNDVGFKLFDDSFNKKKFIPIDDVLKGYKQEPSGLSFIFQKDYVIILSFSDFAFEKIVENKPDIIEKIWVMDRKTNKAFLTYKKK